jgi:hypothetical protein
MPDVSAAEACRPVACYLTGSVLVAAGIAAGNVIAGSFRQRYCPPSLLGRVTASMRWLAYGMIPLGALLAGALGTALGARNALWVLQALFAASALFVLPIRGGLPGAGPRQPAGPLPGAVIEQRGAQHGVGGGEPVLVHPPGDLAVERVDDRDHRPGVVPPGRGEGHVELA